MTADGTRLGVLLPTGRAQWGAGTDPRELVGFATHAERLGYDSLWVNDSLVTPRIEALTMLAAVAPVTTRVTLGTAALLPVLRRPVSAAQSLASIDLLSGGRLVLAVGAGFPGRLGRPMYDLSEVPWRDRFTRLDETVALWRRLWTADGPSSYHGRLLRFDELPPATRPYRPGGPPIWLGGATPAALARTGRHYDGWLPYPPDPADYAAGWSAVRDAAGAAGRDPAALTPALFVTLLVCDDVAAAERTLAEYSQVTYGMPLDVLRTIQVVLAGPAARIVERLRPYLAGGARHLVCRIAALDLASQRDQLERIAELLPLLGTGPGDR
ncbi:LLM class flavin-dependent oxidoreductase [Micromonospora sp. NPDC049559]|uniref:LLM class flavin-dependent oxidoreductase n=1 Tax=Micromonospora sp. NPDC049559 TaxID=3155923 RepID=UPI003431892E